MSIDLISPPEIEFLVSRMAFVDAQEKLSRYAPVETIRQSVTVGHYGGHIANEQGSFAYVRSGVGLDAMVGEFVRLDVDSRSVSVYVLGREDFPAEITLSRRAVFAIGHPSDSALTASLALLG